MWNVDHDHETGRIRGVLCFQCNVGIGRLGDTLEGVMRAELGDYIIRGVKGEFYPVKDEIFRMTYEEVVDAT